MTLPNLPLSFTARSTGDGFGGDHDASPYAGASRAKRSAPRPPAVRVLIVTDDPERAAALQRTFTRNGHTVHVAAGEPQRRRLLRQHAPGIAIISTTRRGVATQQAIDDVKQDGSARVILVISPDPPQRTVIELLRRNAEGYQRTSSITLGGHASDQSVWTWLAALSNTLCLEPAAPRRPARGNRST